MSNDSLIPRTGMPTRLIEGPKIGQTSLYRQRVLDVSISTESSLLTFRKTPTPTPSRISSLATFSPTYHTFTQPMHTSRLLPTMTLSCCRLRYAVSLRLRRKRRAQVRGVKRRGGASCKTWEHHTCPSRLIESLSERGDGIPHP